MNPFKEYYILLTARDEFIEARKWYASQNVKGLRNRFALAVKDAILKIPKNPGAYAVRYKDVRIAHVTFFPYAIHFLTEGNTMIITVIIYDRRNPAITMKRV